MHISFLALILTFLFAACSSIKDPVHYTSCTVYSYMDLFKELSEEQRLVDSKIVFDTLGNKVSKSILSKDGSISRTHSYFYNKHNKLDSVITTDEENRLKEEYIYDQNQNLLAVYEIYRNNRMQKEQYVYKDSVHASTKHYMGGSPSSISQLEYNKQNLLIRRSILSPQGDNWGYKEFEYNNSGKLKTVTTYRSNGAISEVTNYSYNSHNLLEWEITRKANNKVLSKLKYEYSN